jgi:hypothetical protein
MYDAIVVLQLEACNNGGAEQQVHGLNLRPAVCIPRAWYGGTIHLDHSLRD